MTSSSIRVGIVGAGQNTRVRHLPGFRALPGVEIVGVVNRTPESSAQVAQDWKIRNTYPHWRALIDDPQIDAVVIGTWPDLHCEVTCAALAAGKHVLCEARMARNLSEARQMQAASQLHPDRVSMLVPSPLGLICESELHELIGENYLGDLREFVLLGCTNQFFDYSQPLHWRQDAQISGNNILALGILHETWLRWFPQPERIIAQVQTFERQRPNPGGQGNVPVTVPDSVQVLAQLSNGARGVYHLSGIQQFGPGYQLHLYGSAGTVKIRFTEDDDQVSVGRVGDAELRPLVIPLERRGKWRVEDEFISAIRGHEPVRWCDFATGVRYMAFIDAVAQSAAEGKFVALAPE